MSEKELVLGRQALKSKATRENIIKAVVSLIKEGGFPAASASRIAERAGITWGAAQHHFGSKEEILDEVMEVSHAKFVELMAKTTLRKGSMADRVDNYVDQMWRHYQDDLYLAALEILLATRESQNSRFNIHDQSQGHIDTFRDIFYDSSLTDEGMFEALIFLHTFLTGLTVEKVFEKDIQNIDRHLRRIKLILLGMLSFG